MKTSCILLLLSLICVLRSSAQIIAEDASGESSVIKKNADITFNLAEAGLSATWNNFRKLAIEKPVQVVWGLSASGANQDGLSDLFNGGHLTPKSKIGGFIGFRKSYQTATFDLLQRIKEIQNSTDIMTNAEARKTVRQLNDQIQANRIKEKTKALTVYLNSGFTASQFRLYDPISAATLADRFQKVNFRGGFADLGINYEYGPRWTFGLSAGYEHYNNLDSLSNTDYTLRNTITEGNNQLITEKKHNAYQGSYVTYNRISIKTDVLYFAKISDDYRVVWNTLYTRLIFPLQENRINKIIQAGTAVNFYKNEGKFAGGLYLQANDLFNNLQSTDKFPQRLSFGVVAKYAFSSIAGRAFSN